MKNFAVPSTLWVAILLILPPLLIPVIEQFFPSNAYWWSALAVVLLNAVVLIVKATWPDKTGEVVISPVDPNAPVPLGAPDPAVVVTTAPRRSLVSKLLVFGD